MNERPDAYNTTVFDKIDLYVNLKKEVGLSKDVKVIDVKLEEYKFPYLHLVLSLQYQEKTKQ